MAKEEGLVFKFMFKLDACWFLFLCGVGCDRSDMNHRSYHFVFVAIFPLNVGTFAETSYLYLLGEEESNYLKMAVEAKRKGLLPLQSLVICPGGKLIRIFLW